MNKRKLKKWLKDNFNTEFVQQPAFTIFEIKDKKDSLNQKEVQTKFMSVSSFQFRSIEQFKKYFVDNKEASFFVYEMPKGEIFEQFNGEAVFRIRMAVIEKNRRYKLKLKGYE